jgi:hypothetical protein
MFTSFDDREARCLPEPIRDKFGAVLLDRPPLPSIDMGAPRQLRDAFADPTAIARRAAAELQWRRSLRRAGGPFDFAPAPHAKPVLIRSENLPSAFD